MNEHIKLTMYKFFKILRIITMLTLLGVVFKRASTCITNYFAENEFPDLGEITIILILVLLVVIMHSLKHILQEKCDGLYKVIQQRQHINQRKEELRARYLDKQIEKDFLKELNEKNTLPSFSHVGEKSEMPVRTFEVHTIQKSDANLLEELIGLEPVRDQVNRIKATILYENMHGGTHDARIPHMVFSGNPGTGKTTVAKSVAAILYDAGIIKEPKYIAINANDLQGQYLGETPLVVNSLFNQAAGGVLFIDEAYALTSTITSNGSGYGMEAINQLLTHLEDPKNGTLCIFAGYDYDLMRLFDMNPGLRSRIPITIHFDDYSNQDLLDILKMNLSKMGHVVGEEVDTILLEVFAQKKAMCAYYKLPFGNGRYSRNLANAIHGEHALRFMQDNSIGTVISRDDINRDALIMLE